MRAIKQLTQKIPQPKVGGSGEDSQGQSLADLVRRGSASARDMSERVEDVLSKSRASGVYPSFKLAGHLRTVSQLIQADLGIRVFYVELGGDGFGGFDNHANQRDNHAAWLREMSASLAAFVDDLGQPELLERVLLMTFSEFGRTVTESGRRGTNHGAAAPSFLVGGGLKGGLCGEHPDLTDLNQDAPNATIDFRRLYATVLQNWLRFDATSVLGSEYKTLDVFA